MTVFDKSGDKKVERPAKPLRRDSAVTAEFNYIDDWGDDFGDDETRDKPSSELRLRASARGNDDPVTRAVGGMDGGVDDYTPSANLSGGLSVSGSASGQPQAGFRGTGFDQPQVSGIFSRYEEETRSSDSDEFDLFEDVPSAPVKAENPLQKVVSKHDKQIRRLYKQVAYQKEIIQVISELLVESTVISRDELKKRLQALREKSR